MRPALISIRFCGGCNPRIDRGRIARELQRILEEKGLSVMFNKTGAADLMIFLSGCLSGCAFKFNAHKPSGIMIAGETVDTEIVDESLIVQEVLRKVETL